MKDVGKPDTLKIITGEKIQELTDHTIVLRGQYYVEEQFKHTNCKYTYFEPSQRISELPEDILKAKSLFVYTHILDFFFYEIYPLLKHSFVLVTHNSDYGISEKYERFIAEGKIIKWFAQNVEYDHPKLVPIPIGLANLMWPHGNLETVKNVQKENNRKEMLVYKNFEINTAANRRLHVDQATSVNGIYMSSKKPHVEYLRDISKSYFTICPMGNGIDSHRVWESLYLGAIPIVVDCIHFRGFSNLPMIKVANGEYGNWNAITTSYLERALEKISAETYCFEQIDLDYWKNRIQLGI
jgi:hypothetical protein